LLQLIIKIKNVIEFFGRVLQIRTLDKDHECFGYNATFQSYQRKKIAMQLQNSVMSVLRNLGLKNANFLIQFSECKPSSDGINNIYFLFSANPDQKLAPLSNVISGGENISSIEIENTLAKHPSVSIAAVVAKPDEKWGEVPCAFIEKVQDKDVSEKELIDFCRETLAGFKIPKKVAFCELPKTSTGKIQKFELRKKAKE